MRSLKRPVKIVLCVLLALLLVAAAYLAYVLIDYHRIEDNQPCFLTEVSAGDYAGESVQTGTQYRIVSANIGFGAYSADYSFFMDGGKESRARSMEDVVNNVTGSAAVIAEQQPDFVLAQEIDFDSTRSHHVEERSLLVNQLLGKLDMDYCSYSFAQNYDSPYLFYPFDSPHGANKSGILTYSAFPITSALRRSLPIETSLMKLVDLDRCYSVNRIDTANGKELVLYNLHLSAYTSDGTIAVEQLELLLADMKAEYEAGNYCIAGGDFNKDLPGNSGELFGVPTREGDTWAQPVPDGIVPDGLTLVVPLHEDAPVASCRTAAEPYNIETTFRITVDGFVVSDNVTVSDSNVIETDYAYSDHNPVYLDFTLQ